MIKLKIKSLREKLNNEINEKSILNAGEILRISQELDLLILEYYNKNHINILPESDNNVD